MTHLHMCIPIPTFLFYAHVHSQEPPIDASGQGDVLYVHFYQIGGMGKFCAHVHNLVINSCRGRGVDVTVDAFPRAK